MQQYAKINISCTSRKKVDKQIYKEFKERMKKYVLDEEMQLYKIPVLSEDYQYAHQLAQTYGRDEAIEDIEEYPGLYIMERGEFETEYNKKDYEQAVAYLVSFCYLAYPYETVSDSDYEGPCCEKPEWKRQEGLIQDKLYKIPKSEFKNRKYAQLMFGFAVHEEVKHLLIENQLASEHDFQKVITKRNETVCYQLKPENVITGFAKDNDMEVFDYCRNCGLPHVYFGDEPHYMSETTQKQLKGLNQTRETHGPIFRDEKPLFAALVEPWYIVNKDVYNLLHAHYPRMQFIPIFAKETDK